MTREQVRQVQRARMLRAIAEATAERGYVASITAGPECSPASE
jgi:hypothetical protein